MEIICPICGEECEGEAPREKRPYQLHCECECGFEFCYDDNRSEYYDMDGNVIASYKEPSLCQPDCQKDDPDYKSGKVGGAGYEHSYQI